MRKEVLSFFTILFLLAVTVVEAVCMLFLIKEVKNHDCDIRVERICAPIIVEYYPETESSEPSEETTVTYDVPLDEGIQKHIIKVSEENGIDPKIIIAMAQRESSYIADAVGDNGASIGLLQIQSRWHKGRMERLGCTNLYDPYENVTVGVDFLAELLDRYGDIGKALTAYNRGSYEGTVTEYAQAIMTIANELEEKKDV